MHADDAARRSSHRLMLRAGVSLLALLASGITAEARDLLRGNVGAPAAASAAAMMSVQQAAATAQQSMNALSRATQALQAQRLAQSGALAAAVQAANTLTYTTNATKNFVIGGNATNTVQVTDGLAPGGLVPDGTTPWINAQAPTQTVASGGQPTVTVKQTAAKAILSWQSFNVGAATTLNFDQQGNNNWIALNRVNDPSGVPSLILGRMHADGEIYVINRNGIIFGGSSQVNVHALVASALDVGLATHSIAQRNADFLNANSGALSFSFQYVTDSNGNVLPSPVGGSGTLYTALSMPQEGDVGVNAGAQIATPALGVGNDVLGRVVLAAPNVRNDGMIQTPDGQTILVAARHFTLYDNDQGLLAANGNPTTSDSNIRGLLVNSAANDYGALGIPAFSEILLNSNSTFTITPLNDPAIFAGQVLIGGTVAADRGNITAVGNSIQITGTLAAATSVQQNGSIYLTGLNNNYVRVIGPVSLVTSANENQRLAPESLPGQVTIGSSGLLALLLDDSLQSDGKVRTLPSDLQSTQNFKKSVVNIAAQAGKFFTTSDAQLLQGSALLISTPYATPAGQITLQGGSLIKAPSATVTLTATSEQTTLGSTGQSNVNLTTLPPTVSPSIFIAAGAVLDVSGLADVQLPISSVLVAVPRVGLNELADAPVLRNSPLYRSAVLVDRRYAGTRADGTRWEGTPLFNANGYVDGAGQTVEQLMQTGGTVTLSGVTAFQSGALINIAGGYIHYLGGTIATTRLIGTDGHLYDISQADPSVAYRGLAGLFTVNHPAWNVTETFGSALLMGGHYVPDYVQGANAGSLTVIGPAALDGTISAGVVVGPNQNLGTGALASAPPLGGTLNLGGTSSATGSWTGSWINNLTIAGSAAPNLPTGLQPGTAVPSGVFLNPTLSADQLTQSGISVLNLVAQQSVTVTPDAKLALAPGQSQTVDPQTGKVTSTTNATLSIAAPQIEVAGSLTAHGGTISITLQTALFGPASASASAFNSAQSPTSIQPPRVSFALDSGGVLDVSGIWVNDRVGTPGFVRGTSFVNGGTVQIQDMGVSGGNANTNGGTNPVILQDVATVTLAPGSLVDLTSGGYVASNGKLVLDSTGKPLGLGGNFSLTLQGGSTAPPIVIPLDPATVGLPLGQARELLDQRVTLGNTWRADGFQGGGSFSLTVPVLRIGQSAFGGTGGNVTVPVDFLQTAGFGSYNLTGQMTASIDRGTHLTLLEPQLIPTAAVGSAASIADAATVGIRTTGVPLAALPTARPAPISQRPPVNLTLAAYGWTDYTAYYGAHTVDNTVLTQTFNISPSLGAALVADGITIVADATAKIALSAVGQLTFGGTISAPGGTVSLTEWQVLSQDANGTQTSFANGNLTSNASLLLRPGSLIDVSGGLVVDTTQGNFRAGQVLPGGSVTLAGRRMIVPAGVIIDVSGSSGVLDLPAIPALATPRSATRAATLVASDAGSVTLSGTSLLDPFIYINTTTNGGGSAEGAFEGTIRGLPGGPTNQGATVSVTANRLTITETGSLLPSNPQPNAPLPAALPVDTLVIAAGLLTGNGIDALSLNSVDSFSGQSGTSTFAPSLNPGLIAFSGSPVLALGRELDIAAPGALTWLPHGIIDPAATLPTGPSAGSVSLSAPYVSFGAQRSANFSNITFGRLTGAQASLNVAGGTVDFGGSTAINNFTAVGIASAGDMRFVPLATNSSITAASLTAAADLTLTAAQIYPATGVTASITSSDPNGSVTISSSGNTAPVPLSAGGSLTITAASISQGGVLRAPFGTIQLGVTGTTGTVSLQKDSLTSVSGNGALIPYGTTVNQTNWYFTAQAINLNPTTLSAPPAKQVIIQADKISQASGATLDLSGGGDIFAPEFIPGTGGSRNILETNLTGNAKAPVYTILPGRQPAVGPVDPILTGNAFETGSASAAPPLPRNGQTLTLLAGVAGLPAGTYTLYAGDYANLPGAFRVQALTQSTQDLPAGRAVTLADGSSVVAGRLGVAGTAIQSSRTLGFSIMPEAVWRSYTQIAETTGTSFFSALAAASATPTAVPRLPIDAGQLQLAVGSSLSIGGTNLFVPAPGGRGGQVDITAAGGNLEVASAGIDGASGYALVRPTDLSRLAVDSILLGGTRGANANIFGDTITASARNLLINTTAADPLVNPELLLATTSAGLITIGANSVVAAQGQLSGAPNPITITTAISGSFLGNDTLIRLSQGGPVLITRASSTGSTALGIQIGANALLDGKASLQFGTVDNATLDPTAQLKGISVEIGANNINILGSSTTQLTLGAGTLAGLAGTQNLTLKAYSAINFNAPVTLGATPGGQFASLMLDTPAIAVAGSPPWSGIAKLQAGTVTLTNDLTATASPTPVNSSSRVAGTTLQIVAGQLAITGNDKQIQGFTTLDFAADEIRFGAIQRLKGAAVVPTNVGTPLGTLSAIGDIILRTPQLVLANGSYQTISTTKSFQLVTPPGSSFTDTDQIGGRLDVTAGTATAGTVVIDIESTVLARAGVFNLHATSGDVKIGAMAQILAGGYTQSFVDTKAVFPGGAVGLTADAGNVSVLAGARLDLAGQPGGDAGSLSITLGSASSVSIDPGTVFASGGAVGAASSSFLLNSQGAVNLDAIAAIVTSAGFSNRVAIASGVGNMVLSAVVPPLATAAPPLAAAEIDLTANGGSLDVARTLNASGAAGGKINLYGTGGVTLEPTAQLLATASDPTQRGGQVNIGVSGTGLFNLMPGSRIDVTGGSPYGSGGGTIHYRMPFANSSQNSIVAGQVFAATLVNPTSVIIEPYWQIDDTGVGVTTGFGTPSGSGLFNAPSASNNFNPNMAALQTRFASLAPGRVHVQPGLELDSSSATLTIASGVTAKMALDLSSPSRRYNGEPGWLTIRAKNNLVIDGTISDGFNGATSTSLLCGSAAVACTSLSSWSYRFVAGANLASADPLAVRPLSAFPNNSTTASYNITNSSGNIVFGDQTATVNNRQKYEVIRTGTGSISLAAGRSIILFGANQAIYTAGVNTATPANFTAGTNQTTGGWLGNKALHSSDSTFAFPTNGGDIVMTAQLDINDPNFVGTGGGKASLGDYQGFFNTAAGANSNGLPNYGYSYTQAISSQVVPWLGLDGQSNGSPTVNGVFSSQGTGPGTQSAEFVFTDQVTNAVATLGGGNLTARAGGNVRDAMLYDVSTFRVTGGTSAASPPVMTRYGGGNLLVQAGNSILGGVFYDAGGTATVAAGDGLAKSGAVTTIGVNLAIENASARVAARSGIALLNVFHQGIASITATGVQPKSSPIMSLYGTGDGLTVMSVAGDIALASSINGLGTLINNKDMLLPPTVTVADGRGSITMSGIIGLAPAPRGTLNLLADDTLVISGAITMFDIGADQLATPLHPQSTSASGSPANFYLAGLFPPAGASSSNVPAGWGLFPSFASDGTGNLTAHAGPTPLHTGDTSGPARLIALTGDVKDAGNGNSAGVAGEYLAKATEVWAGRDIQLTFEGQNVASGDTTLIRAGRDILNSTFIIGGPGALDILAGRSVLLFPTLISAAGGITTTTVNGIQAVGNLINPWLQPVSADVNLLFGVGPGLDPSSPAALTSQQAFIDRYINPANAGQVPVNYLPQLASYMNESTGQAFADFLKLSATAQLPFIEQVLFNELRSIAPGPNQLAVNDPAHIARAYQAVNTLFPAAAGFTNDLASNPSPIQTGNLNMTDSMLRTDFGSSFNILGPGGNALLGTILSNPNLQPQDQGIFTTRGGNINVFLDGNLTVNQSRVLTEQGGDVTVFAANGNIDAGRGRKTVSSLPPFTVQPEPWLSLINNPVGQTAGSGIATLQTLPGTPPGNVYLLAPHGDINAGDAGIRASGNLSVLAVQVLNADNIVVQGTTSGIPTAVLPNIGAQIAFTNTSGAAATEAARVAKAGSFRQPVLPQDLPSIITVEVLGYGGTAAAAPQAPDPKSAVQVLGYGALTPRQVQPLTDAEKKKLETP